MMTEMRDQMDGVNMDNQALREKLAERERELRELRKTVKDNKQMAMEANCRSNRNGQYSRKNNIKLYGVSESHDEKVKEKVIKTLREAANVELQESEIIATQESQEKREEQDQ
ncbi:tropomyosin-2-like [Lingula anatina]|uniref:Tropomyosin-2-like n=1 Tax=Lingula anatina TaxID=7574 RepID=A0A1S3IGT5_LINAN|nr:tropomyosin-2-like [Lingula anatina]|eukprot:XP_013397071.1 tropomyosin-2-like [Lingula anatina]